MLNRYVKSWDQLEYTAPWVLHLRAYYDCTEYTLSRSGVTRKTHWPVRQRGDLWNGDFEYIFIHTDYSQREYKTMI